MGSKMDYVLRCWRSQMELKARVKTRRIGFLDPYTEQLNSLFFHCSSIIFFKRTNFMEMPDLGTSSRPEKKTQFPNLLIPLLILLSSFLLSHPLYFLKLLSFLSPLLITTFLILLFTSYRTVVEKLRGDAIGRKEHLELDCSEGSADESEVFKIFFEASHLEDESQEPEELVDKFLICEDNGVGECLQEENIEEENDNESNDDGSAKAEKTLEELFQEKEEGNCEAVDLQVVDEKEVKEVKEAEAETENCDPEIKKEECASRAWRNSRRLSSSLKIPEKSSGGLAEEKASLVLGGFGSMRQTEKEWKRTLACKLFEERHRDSDGNGNVVSGKGVGDGEGMDLLWETYDKNDSTRSTPMSDQSKKAAKESKKLREELQEEEEEDEDEEEEMSRQYCCLQALKLSAGKVSLGMGKPNIAKISKAFRGIGWLHHVRARKGLLH